MRTERVARRQNMRQQNTNLKAILVNAQTVNRGLAKLDQALHEGYKMGFEAGVASVSAKQEVSNEAK